MLITPEQIRAARALLRMDQDELARRARVSTVTVRRMEAADGMSKVASSTVDEVRRTLEQAGAEFVENGVRRRRTEAEIEELVRTGMEIAKRSAELLRNAPPFTEHDLYDEDGLPGDRHRYVRSHSHSAG